jgi:hypothetical protein
LKYPRVFLSSWYSRSQNAVCFFTSHSRMTNLKVLEQQRKSKDLQEGWSKYGLVWYPLADRGLPGLETASMLVGMEAVIPLLSFEEYG